MTARVVNYKAGETVNQMISLELVTTSHNPRKPLPALQDLGIDPMEFCHQFGLSDDPEKRQHFVETIREHHPEIVDTWDSYQTHEQIQPIILRDFRAQQEDGSYLTRYGIACGERRYITCVYGQAVTGQPYPVRAIVKKMTVKEAYWMGAVENLLREDMSEVEKGQIFAAYAKEHTLTSVTDADGNTKQEVTERASDAQEPLPMTEVAKHFHRPYHFVRGRAALATQLPQDRMQLYLSGKLNLTDAIKEALNDPTHVSKPPKERRSNPLTMKQIQTLFDRTPRSNMVRLETLAEVMKLDLATALAESEARIQAQEDQEARQAEKDYFFKCVFVFCGKA